jgi:cytoskeletal protein CcmA (bactofilin family)
MTELPRRRLMDRIGSSPSLLAPKTRVIGDIETDGALLVNGSVQGDGRIGGELALSAGARWDGDIHARRALVAGEIHGTLIVEEKLEIGSTAVIRGRVMARQIAIARGATIDGEMKVTGSEPVLEFEEKRAVVPAQT